MIALNRIALGQLHCEKRLEIIPGATHFFEELGALEEVARRARDWFTCSLAAAPDHPTFYAERMEAPDEP